jgi:SpoVK/Ycf46/Vps4 family AAA+-type ATPase
MSTLTPATNDWSSLPPWANELRRRYLRGESSQFVLYGNVHDLVLFEGKLYSVSELLSQVLFERSKDNVLLYNVSTGVRFTKRKVDLGPYSELVLKKEPSAVLPQLERLLTTADKVALVLEYADTIAPAQDLSFSTVDDRAAAITLHRWSLLRSLEQADSIVVLTLENLSDLNQRIVSNPRVATVEVPMPSADARTALIRHLQPGASEADVTRLAESTSGLKLLQIRAILSPADDVAVDVLDERKKFLTELLSGGQAATDALRERVDKLAQITHGMGREQIRKLIAPDGKAPAIDSDARAEVDRLVAARKREIIERECFGLLEFVTSSHGFDVVGGMDEVKRELSLVAENLREGRRNRCPMGLLFTGPMGTGKTFVAEAFAKEAGLTAVKLKNFRSKWVGATEGNLEKILTVIKAIGQVIVIIDEGDRAFGSGGDGDGDGGTSSRVIARIKEFMSDTSNRGRVLFILMTNRPDKLDVDLKRAGRLDRKIPFLYPQSVEEVAGVMAAQVRKNRLKTEVKPKEQLALWQPLVGYSNADLESVALLANDAAAARAGSNDAPVLAEDFAQAAHDYMPSRDTDMLEFMELLAVFEASNRRMLPRKYAEVSLEALQARLNVLRATVGSRR